LACHIFKEKDLKTIKKEIWLEKPEPLEDDPEVIKNKDENEK